MFKIIDENFRVLCTDIQNIKQDRGKPGSCAEIHALIYYFILPTDECQETVAKVVSVSYK